MGGLTNESRFVGGNLLTIRGREHVHWLYNVVEAKTWTEEEFRLMTDNDFTFMQEWATNRYPLRVNDWSVECVASHIDDDGTCSLHFVVNNAIMAIDATVAILAITYEAGTNQVKTELIELING